MSSIFVSYRRTDAPAHAGRIYDRLVERFGKDSVFRDRDSTVPGADFAEVIDHTIANCDALVAVIGREWLTAARWWHRGRLLDNPQDWVRREIAAALQRNIRVVPVLVEGARMPSAHELPEEIQMLARRHAVELTEAAWTPQLEQLIDFLSAPSSTTAIMSSGSVLLPRATRKRAASRRFRRAAAAITACAVMLGGAVALVSRGDSNQDARAAPDQRGLTAPAPTSVSLSADAYRLRLINICTEHLQDAERIKHAEPNRPVFGITLQLEARTTDKLKTVRPPSAFEPEHRRILELWSRRLSILGYYWDRYERQRNDPAFIREFQHQLKRIDDLSLDIQRNFESLGVTPECDIFGD